MFHYTISWNPIAARFCVCVLFRFNSILFFVVSIIEANESNNKFNTLDTFRYIRDKGNVKIFLFFWFALCVHSRSQSLISDSIAMAFLVKHLDNLSLLHSSQIVFFFCVFTFFPFIPPFIVCHT